MTKAHLQFGTKSLVFDTRRFRNQHFRSRAYKTDATPAPDERTEEELLEVIDKRTMKLLEKYATPEELTEIREAMKNQLKGEEIVQLRAMADAKEGAMALLTRQGLEIQRLKASIKAQPEDMSLRAQVAKWQEANKEAIGKVKNREQNAGLPMFELNLQYRVNSPMLPSNSLGSSVYLPKPEFAPGIVDLVRPDPTFWDYVKKGATSSAAYVWVNKKNPLGAAAFIAPGVYKPGISFTINTQISTAKKIAANEKMAVELLDDIDGMTGWIEDELIYQVKQKASLTLMSGVADDNTPAGIQTLSVPFAFAALGLKTTNANTWDVIRSGVAQLRSGNFRGGVTAFLNPIDFANMVMTKAQNQGQSFIPPATGATIVEDNNVPIGNIQMAILDNYKVLIYKALQITWGLENDDFTKNLRTVIGEMRIHQFFSENHVGSFLYDTIANGVAGLTPAP